ncbi:hypothetical protein [Moorena producens]|uniref:hypothetical protein n=1 Tax=Moorena producens TaxID=1155739 RepID=UPI003C720D2A
MQSLKLLKTIQALFRKISELESNDGQFELEPNSPEVQGLRNYVGEYYDEEQIRSDINLLLTLQADDYLKEVLYVANHIDEIRSWYPDIETLQKTFVKLKNELKIWQKEIQSELLEIESELVHNHIRIFIDQTEQNYGYRTSEWKLSQEEIENLYKEIQRQRAELILQPAKITGAPDDSQISKQAAQEIANLDQDYKLVRLIALLEDKGSDINEKFRAMLKFLPTASDNARNTLKKRYQIIQGRDLVQDIETTFNPDKTKLEKLSSATIGRVFSNGEGDKLQLPVLKQLLETGQVAPIVEVALELGLLYRGITTSKVLRFSMSENYKDKIRQLVEENPGELAQLASTEQPNLDGDNEDIFLPYVYKNLKEHHKGFFGEIQRFIIGTENDSSSSTETSDLPTESMTTGDQNADYLISLIYDNDLEPRKIDDREELQQRILNWTISFSETERKKIINSAKILGQKTFNKNETLDSSETFWYLLREHHRKRLAKNKILGGSSLSVNWCTYTKNLVDAQGKDEKTRRIHELNALLEYQASKYIWDRKNQREQTKEKVLNLLSTQDSWDAEEAVRQYCEEMRQGDHKEWLKRQLKKAGLNSRDRDEVNRQLSLRGAYPGAKPIDELRQMGIYQQLKRKRQEEEEPLKIVETLSQVKPGSFDYHLIREDYKLLKRLYDDLKQSRYSYQRLWENCANLLSLPDYEMSLTRSLSEPEFFNRERLERGKEFAKENYWASRLAMEYLITAGDDRRRKVLKLVFQAQIAGVEGAALTKTLKKIDQQTFDWVETTTLSPQQSERKAAELLRKYLQGEAEEIKIADLLDVSEGFLADDGEMIAFSVEVLTPDQVVDFWFAESVKRLKTLAEERRKLSIQLLSAQFAKNEAEATTLAEQLNTKNKVFKNFQLEVDEELKTKLRQVASTGKAAELQRQLLDKVGQAFTQRTSKTIRELPLTPSETDFKGLEASNKSLVLKERYLETAIGWHHFSPAGTAASLDTGKFLSIFSEVGRVFSLDPTKADIEQELLQKVQASMEALGSSLDRWKETQDRAIESVVYAVTQTVSILGATSALALGVAAAPALVQLAWALGNSAGQTFIRQVVSSALSRSGDRNPKLVLQEVLTETAQGVTQFFVTNELAVGLNIGLIYGAGLDTTSKKIFADPALKMMTTKLTSVISELIAAAIAAPFLSNSFDSERLRDVFLKFSGKSSILSGITQYGQKFAEGISDLLYNSVMGFIGGRYDRTTDFNKLYPTREQKEQALRNLFNFMDGASQFVGGPTDNMGASTWIMSDEALDQNPWSARVGHSLKTSLYEELLLPKFLDQISFSVEAGLSTTADSSEQPGGEPEPKSVEKEKAIDRAVSHSIILALSGTGITFPDMEMTLENTDNILTAALEQFPEAERDTVNNVFQQLKNTLKQEAENDFDNQDRLAEETIQKIKERLQQDLQEGERNPVSRHYERQLSSSNRSQSPTQSPTRRRKSSIGTRKALGEKLAPVAKRTLQAKEKFFSS